MGDIRELGFTIQLIEGKVLVDFFFWPSRMVPDCTWILAAMPSKKPCLCPCFLQRSLRTCSLALLPAATVLPMKASQSRQNFLFVFFVKCDYKTQVIPHTHYLQIKDFAHWLHRGPVIWCKTDSRETSKFLSKSSSKVSVISASWVSLAGHHWNDGHEITQVASYWGKRTQLNGIISCLIYFICIFSRGIINCSVAVQG